MNHSCAVVYVSKYGATEKYARMIAEKLSADLYDYTKMPDIKILGRYHVIIWGGGIYAGKINGLQAFVEQAEHLQTAQKIIFSVGNTPVDRNDLLEKVWRNSVSARQYSSFAFFHFEGRVNFSGLSFSDRRKMDIVRLALLAKPKKNLSRGERQFLSEYGKDSQVIDEAATDGLISAVQQPENIV